MASQQKLGLLPERRAWIDLADPDHSVALGTHLIIKPENANGKRTELTGKVTEETKELDQQVKVGSRPSVPSDGCVVFDQGDIKMSKAFVGALIAAAALTGCTKKSEEGGRAGNDTFRIVVPAMATAVKQGEVQTVRVVLERGAGFKQRVKLEVRAPEGVQVEPKEAMVQPGDKGDIQLKITVAKDAAIGEHKIVAKGTPDKGEPTEAEFKLTVSAN